MDKLHPIIRHFNLSKLYVSVRISSMVSREQAEMLNELLSVFTL